MSELKWIRVFTLAILTVSIGFANAFAQQPDKNKPSQDPSDRPRTVRSEPKNAHKKWVTEDVPYIITAAEKKAFFALQTDDERENFIATFWRNRDPDQDTEENEYREE
jgi:hypothetical protein